MAKVIVLALDGAEKNLLLNWADDGTLPTIRSLMDSGTWCTVDNPPALFAGSLWPSFYTGVSPARHGKYCSHQLKTGTYDNHRVHGFDSRFDTIWDVLSREGRKSVIIDAPKTEVPNDFNGIQVIDWATEDFERDLRSWPPELASEVKEKYGINPVVERHVNVTDADSLNRLRAELMSRLQRKSKMSADILAQDHWDFFFTLFTEVHTAGHLCWHLQDNSHPNFDEKLADSVGDVMRDVYVATDAALEQFVNHADEDTHVFVYSVNGMGANYTGVHLLDDVLLARDRMRLSGMRYGLARTADWVDAQIPGRIYDRVYWLQRIIRRGLSLPVRDRRYRSAFHVPTNAIAGGVRVNLIGREPQGIISEDEYDEYCSELVDSLSSLINVDTGNTVARRVLRTQEVFDGEHSVDLPDILVEWAQEAPVSRVYSPDTGEINKECSGNRTGDHRPDGILFVVGPGSARGALEEHISIYDFAPTISRIIGSRFPVVDGEDVSRRLGINCPMP